MSNIEARLLNDPDHEMSAPVDPQKQSLPPEMTTDASSDYSAP
jgi:hypothetical protein